jgi:hypothetical protein
VLRPCAGVSESAASVVERPAGLDRQVTATDEIALSIFGDLSRDEDQLASSRDDHMGVCLGSGQIRGLTRSSGIDSAASWDGHGWCLP